MLTTTLATASMSIDWICIASFEGFSLFWLFYFADNYSAQQRIDSIQQLENVLAVYSNSTT